MKNLLHQTANASRFRNNDYFISQRLIRHAPNQSLKQDLSPDHPFQSTRRETPLIHDLFTTDTVRQMAEGQIPDLWGFCLDLAGMLNNHPQPDHAMAFIPLMQSLDTIERDETEKFLKNPVSRYVLASNERLEVVLIHWKPGKASDIHGHPEGGCLFKVLSGKLEEVRYSPETSPKLLGFHSYRKGSLAYIDNRMAYHQVGNPYGSPAVSLHIYLK